MARPYNAQVNTYLKPDGDVKMQTQWMTVEEAARELAVHPETIRKWIKEGELNAVVYKRTYRIRREDFDDFIRRHSSRK